MEQKDYKKLNEVELQNYRNEYKKLLKNGNLKLRQEFKHNFFSLKGYSEAYKSETWISIIGR